MSYYLPIFTYIQLAPNSSLFYNFLFIRVLGFADLMLDPKVFTKDYQFCAEPANFPKKNLRFVGFMSLIDPPRPQVPDALERCRSAGIRVVMVTGDHPVR